MVVSDGLVVGLLDLELEPAPGLLWDTDERGGVIWHVAVHPGFRRRAFAHYVGGQPVEDELRARFERTHDDVLYERAV